MENKFTGFLIDSKSVVVAIFSNDLTHASVASYFWNFEKVFCPLFMGHFYPFLTGQCIPFYGDIFTPCYLDIFTPFYWDNFTPCYWDNLPPCHLDILPLFIGTFYPFLGHLYPILIRHFYPCFWDNLPLCWRKKMWVLGFDYKSNNETFCWIFHHCVTLLIFPNWIMRQF